MLLGEERESQARAPRARRVKVGPAASRGAAPYQDIFLLGPMRFPVLPLSVQRMEKREGVPLRAASFVHDTRALVVAWDNEIIGGRGVNFVATEC
eukprot:scaffold63820_cov69-Phaeocystis_antarctica.AAC.2